MSVTHTHTHDTHAHTQTHTNTRHTLTHTNTRHTLTHTHTHTQHTHSHTHTHNTHTHTHTHTHTPCISGQGRVFLPVCIRPSLLYTNSYCNPCDFVTRGNRIIEKNQAWLIPFFFPFAVGLLWLSNISEQHKSVQTSSKIF